MTLTSYDIARKNLANEFSDLAINVIPELQKQTKSIIHITIVKHGFEVAFTTPVTRLSRLVSYNTYIATGPSALGRVLREMATLIKVGYANENGQRE